MKNLKQKDEIIHTNDEFPIPSCPPPPYEK